MRGLRNLEENNGQATQDVERRGQRSHRAIGTTGRGCVAEAARQHGVNESLVHTWKARFLEGGRTRLSGEQPDNGKAALERENDRLKRILAEKELELDISRKVRRQHRGH